VIGHWGWKISVVYFWRVLNGSHAESGIDSNTSYFFFRRPVRRRLEKKKKQLREREAQEVQLTDLLLRWLRYRSSPLWTPSIPPILPFLAPWWWSLSRFVFFFFSLSKDDDPIHFLRSGGVSYQIFLPIFRDLRTAQSRLPVAMTPRRIIIVTIPLFYRFFSIFSSFWTEFIVFCCSFNRPTEFISYLNYFCVVACPSRLDLSLCIKASNRPVKKE